MLVFEINPINRQTNQANCTIEKSIEEPLEKEQKIGFRLSRVANNQRQFEKEIYRYSTTIIIARKIKNIFISSESQMIFRNKIIKGIEMRKTS